MADSTNAPTSSPSNSSGDAPGNEDLKAKMREALERKKSGGRRTAQQIEAREKVHGSEVIGGAPKLHRRKAGGGGS